MLSGQPLERLWTEHPDVPLGSPHKELHMPQISTSSVSSSQHYWTVTEVCPCGSVTVDVGYSSVGAVDMRTLLPAQCCCELKSILKAREATVLYIPLLPLYS